jgi:HTH-type transcriptional regulator/antitoxin MqsA
VKCPSCEAGKLVHDTRDLNYTYKGKSTVLPRVKGDFRIACDEPMLDAAESRRTMNLMLAINKQVNASIVGQTSS